MEINSSSTKTHFRCGHEFIPENIYFHKKSGSRLCRICRRANDLRQRGTDIRREYMRGHRKKWRAKNPNYHKEWHLQKNYGISLEELNTMLEQQKGVCAICGEKLLDPCVDHNHSTKKVRKLLCSGCNFGIGSFNENPHALRKAAEYLEKENAR